MPFICLPKESAKRFREALKSREINMAELINMDSVARTKIFEKFSPDMAKQINTLFEEKLILKNRIQGLKNWASKIGEIGRYDPAKKAKIEESISEYRRAQQERIFNPKENEAFLSDLAEKTLGTNITRTEASTLFSLDSKSRELLKNFDEQTGKWKSEKSRADYGAAKVIYERYYQSLKEPNTRVIDMLKEYGLETKKALQENTPKAIANVLLDSVSKLSDILVSTVATLDNSFIGRQGAITLIRNPKIWWNMAKNSFIDFAKTVKGQEALDVLLADRYSRPNEINGAYEKAKLFPRTEEQFPTSIPEKIPYVGRLFKASEVAFTGSAMRARMDLFDLLYDTAEKQGVSMTDVQIKDIGTVVNALTARGKVGQIGSSKPVQLLLWAPRMLKADWDILTGHTFGSGLETKFARKQVAMNTFRVVTTIAGITAIINAIRPGSVETDPRSSDFLKARFGNTTINNPFTRGMAQIVTLFSRLLTQQSKSTQTKIITELNSGEFGSKTLFDIGLDFLVNKTTPPAHWVINYLKGKDISGNKITIGSSLFGFLPISVQNFIGLKDDSSTQAVIGAFSDLVGIGSNTYSPGTDWEQSTGEELKQFKEKVGSTKFREANDLFNKEVSSMIESLKSNKSYQNKSEEDKQKYITSEKIKIKNSVFKRYGFSYKRNKPGGILGNLK